MWGMRTSLQPLASVVCANHLSVVPRSSGAKRNFQSFVSPTLERSGGGADDDGELLALDAFEEMAELF
jgi:hypothetical protein